MNKDVLNVVNSKLEIRDNDLSKIYNEFINKLKRFSGI